MTTANDRAIEAAKVEAMDKGVDFVFDLLEEALDVKVPRDAATETWDGDVRSVLHRILDAAAWSTQASRDVLNERHRQVTSEGWTAGHDDLHVDGEIGAAAACYALSASGWTDKLVSPLTIIWPWSLKWWKPKDRRSDLVRAGALVLAEIERIDRAGARAVQS